MNHRPDVKVLAHGKWDRILATLGIDSYLLDGHHHECPICGGKDRFRFIDKTGDGDWVCSGHGFRPGKKVGAGKGIDIAMQFFSEAYGQAADRVRQALGSGLAEIPETIRRRKVSDRDPAETLNWVSWMLNSSVAVGPNSPVDRYIKSRGLSIPAPSILRFKANLNFISRDGAKVPSAAMLAPFTDVNNRLIAAHRTYLTADGLNKAYGPDCKQFAGPPTGGAIRLYEPVNGFIALTEGIETALAVHELTGWPVWATGATAFLESVQLPTDITQVMIMADNDPLDKNKGYCPGLHSAKVLAKRLQEEGRHVKIKMPSIEGFDFLDVLNSNKSLKV